MLRLENKFLNLCSRNGKYNPSMGNCNLQYDLYLLCNKIIPSLPQTHPEGNKYEDPGPNERRMRKNVRLH